jgi:uncharacterized membrane protein YkoI
MLQPRSPATVCDHCISALVVRPQTAGVISGNFQVRELWFKEETYMTRTFTIILAIATLGGAAMGAEKKLQMKDLPPAVQKTVQEQTKGAEIKGLSKETEKGKTSYEVETMVNGKHRDFLVDVKGAITEVEDETALDSIPAAAKAAIEKKAGGGKIGMVETMTRGGATYYEAGYTGKDGKKHEVLVKPDGTEVKD